MRKQGLTLFAIIFLALVKPQNHTILLMKVVSHFTADQVVVECVSQPTGRVCSVHSPNRKVSTKPSSSNTLPCTPPSARIMNGSVSVELRGVQTQTQLCASTECVSVEGEAAACISLKLLVCVGSLIIQVRRKQFVLCPSSLEAVAQVARVAKPAGIKAWPRVGMKSPKAPPAGRHWRSFGPCWGGLERPAPAVFPHVQAAFQFKNTAPHLSARTRVYGSANPPLLIYGGCLASIGSKRQTEAETTSGTKGHLQIKVMHTFVLHLLIKQLFFLIAASIIHSCQQKRHKNPDRRLVLQFQTWQENQSEALEYYQKQQK